MPDPAILQPAFDAVIRAKNVVKHQLQAESDIIELMTLSTPNKAAESIATLKGNWSFDEINLGMGVWQSEFTIPEGAITAEDFGRCAAIDWNGSRYTVEDRKPPKGLRRYWKLIVKPIERVET